MPIAHFFFSSDFETRKDPYAAIRSWLSQMISHPRAFQVVYNKQSAQYGETATQTDAVQLFRDIIQVISGCTFVLDGLDECIWAENSCKVDSSGSVVEFLKTVWQTAADTPTRIMIVSRDEPCIRAGLSCIKPENFFQQKVSADEVRLDITSYSRSIVDEKLSKKTEAIKKDLSERMASRCNGQFLLLKLHRNSLESWMNKKQLEDTIDETPSQLKHLYDRYWKRILDFPSSKKIRAFSLLRWVAYALRPLTVYEITEALLTSENRDDFPAEDMPEPIDEDYINSGIEDLCGSLLEVRRNISEPHEGLKTVHLTHFSVREYYLLQLA